MFAELQNRINTLKDEIGFSAGINPLDDRFKAGVVTAHSDVLNITFDELSNGN